jgi:peptidyl-prolyl cis-trans isomerase C
MREPRPSIAPARAGRLGLAGGLALLFALAGPAHADDRIAAVVARVGARVVTVGEVEDRLAQLSPLARASYGDTPEAIRKKFVDEVVVPEVLLELGADQRKISSRPEVGYDLDRTRADATLRAVRAKVGPATSIPEADARKYYEENKARYDAPERVNVWRILCKTREEADTVLASAKKDSAVASWNALARDHSIEKASALRGGNMGFVGPDGTSNEAGVKVDPAVIKAATAVKDGEIVSTPIEEVGAGWSVVWRRGTVGASKRPFEDVAAQIRDTLFKQRVETEMKKLTAELRAKNVTGFAPEVLETVDLTLTEGAIIPRKRPGQVPPLGAPSSSSGR